MKDSLLWKKTDCDMAVSKTFNHHCALKSHHWHCLVRTVVAWHVLYVPSCMSVCYSSYMHDMSNKENYRPPEDPDYDNLHSDDSDDEVQYRDDDSKSPYLYSGLFFRVWYSLCSYCLDLLDTRYSPSFEGNFWYRYTVLYQLLKKGFWYHIKVKIWYSVLLIYTVTRTSDVLHRFTSVAFRY